MQEQVPPLRSGRRRKSGPLLCGTSEFAVAPAEIPEADKQRHHCRKRRRITHQQQRRGIKPAEQPGQRNPEQECCYHTVYHRKNRISLPAEICVEAEHEANDDAVDAIAPQVVCRHVNDSRVFGENASQTLREKLRIDAE